MKQEKKKQLLKKALEYHHVGDLNSADDIYLEILKNDKNDFDANHLHATILSQNKKYSQSINFFSIAYEGHTPTCELLNNYAIALRNLRAYTECESMLLQAIDLDKDFSNFQTALLLGIAYAATIGGISTPIGTAPNIVVISLIQEQGLDVSFNQWMLLALPISIIMLSVGWWLLTNIIFPVNISANKETKNSLQEMYQGLGAITTDEKRVFVIFVRTALAWIFRDLLDDTYLLQGLTDYGIAIIAALAVFITRSSQGAGLIEWSITTKLPWGILILFGGGLSMANAIMSSGLGKWIGGLIPDISAVLLILLIVFNKVFFSFINNCLQP